MKNSDKFWTLVIVILLIYGNIYHSSVREGELVVLIAIIGIYSIINLFYFLWRLCTPAYEEPIIPEEFFIVYWLIILPLKKFNNFLNNL